MTYSVQYSSFVSLKEADEDKTIDEAKDEDSMNLWLSLYDSLNNLSEVLSRLNYTLKKKELELMENKYNLNKKMYKY